MKRKQSHTKVSDSDLIEDGDRMESEEEAASDVEAVEADTTADNRFSPDDASAASGTTEPAVKVPKLSKGALYKPPTNEEMNQLKETENLFHSSLFRMQITELLSEACLKSRRRQDMETAIATVKQTVMNIPQGEKFEMKDTSWLSSCGIQVPFHLQPVDVRGSFQFVPPVDVKLTGSFLMETCVKPNIAVDLIVVMPKACIDFKDYLNQRYLRKRSFYLCVLAEHLMKCEEFTDVKFSHMHGNHLKPVLLTSVKVSGRKNVAVRMHVVPENGVFKLNRFHVHKSNIRAQWYAGTDVENKDSEAGVPTPFYNCTMLEDLIASSDEEQLMKILSSSKALKEGIILLKIWMRQRDIDKGTGGFSSHLLTMFVLYLVSVHKLNSLMSSYQIFRTTLLRLSEMDLTTTGISMCTVTDDVNIPTLDMFHEQADVVFIDSTGYYNYCYSVQKSVYKRLVHEAKLAMSILEDPQTDSFEKLFMKKVTFSRKFDHIFHITCTENMKVCARKLGVQDKLMDYGGHLIHTCISAIANKLQQALSHRVDLLQIVCLQPEHWEVTESPPPVDSGRLTVGLVLNPEFAFNILDRGPAADSPEADDFRKFWGSKSELRRFQDGGICEAALWLENSTYARKQLVCEEVVKYTLLRHAGIKTTNVHYFGKQTDDILSLPIAMSSSKDKHLGTGEELNADILKVFDDLCKHLRNLPDLPLTINSIQGVSECFRFTQVFPTLPCTFNHDEKIDLINSVKQFVPLTGKPCPLYSATLKVVCMLEPSSKWPTDIQAMRRLKAAFYIQISDALKNHFSLPVRVSPTFVDVLKDQYVFRITLACTNEIGMLKSIRSSDGKLLKRDTEEALKLEREIIALPRLTSTLHGLYQQHPSFGTTTRLAKRWISAHMLADFIHPVAVELLVASIYLSPLPFQPPRSGLCGFQRFLELLSTFDWKISPLLVNLNNEFTEADLVEIPTRFSKERTTLPLMFISTPLDKYSSHWTKHNPTANILQRLVLLAVKSLEHIQHQIMEQNFLDLKPVFRPTLSIFDVLIHLEPTQLPRHLEGLDYKSLKHKPLYGKMVLGDKFPVTDYNPAELFVQELKRTFDDIGLFFHDKHGGNVIGVLWKPTAMQAKEFKVSHVNFSQLHTAKDGSVKLIPNMEAIIEDIKILGKGVVSKIEVNST